MRIVLISSYHGGSHRAWAEGYSKYSSHQVELLTLPARFWKWRMHGGAVTLARRFLQDQQQRAVGPPDLLLFTDMVDVSTFLALARHVCPRTPAALYMHENQLTYPLPNEANSGPMRRQKGERDLHYAFINYASMLSADRIFFNSEFHSRELLDELPRFLRHFPEYNELQSVPQLAAKSSVLPVGIDLASLEKGNAPAPRGIRSDEPPLLIWNQRWEYDKNPDQFFKVLARLAQEGQEFRLAVCGEQFAREPREFNVAREQLADHIVHWGYADREQYARLLWLATATVSTAIHEFFGISILEAMYCQTYAALPNRLSYPELLPQELHRDCLYEDENELLEKLKWALQHPPAAREIGRRLSQAASPYDWPTIAPVYDREFERFL
jgi:glycosyltransferase involved in cell wall biosynthesis